MSTLVNVEFWSSVLVLTAIYSVLALGIQVQYGYTGLLNFGHAGFMLVAPYIMAILVVRAGLNLWLAGGLGVAAAAGLGALVAASSVGLRQVFLGMATIGFAEILRYLALNLTDLTGGPLGSANLLGPLTIATYNAQWVALRQTLQDWLTPFLGTLAVPDVVTALVFWLLIGLLVLLLDYICRSPWGRMLRAVREDEEAASAMGKDVRSCRIQAFTIGSALAGLAGVLLALHLTAFSPADFDPTLSVDAYVIIFIAGIAQIAAVPIGALIFTLIYSGSRFLAVWPLVLFTSAQQAYLRQVVVGCVLILIMVYRPQGLFGRRRELIL